MKTKDNFEPGKPGEQRMNLMPLFSPLSSVQFFE